MPGGGKGGGGNSTIDVNNSGTTNVVADSTMTIAGLNNINTTSKNTTGLTLSIPDPIKTDSDARQSVTIRIPDPVRTINENFVDIKPLVADLCFTVTNRTPPTCVRQPYHHRFGIEMYGQEVMAFTFRGESQTLIDDLTHGPQVAWGPVEKGPGCGPEGEQKRERGEGLRVRLGE